MNLDIVASMGALSGLFFALHFGWSAIFGLFVRMGQLSEDLHSFNQEGVMEDDPVARLVLWELMVRQSITATTKPGSRAVMAVMRDGRVVSEWDAEPWLEDLRRMREMAATKEAP